jgi:hypothetical protein
MIPDGENSDSKSSPKLTHQEYDSLLKSILQLDKFSGDKNKLVGVEMTKRVYGRYEECNLGSKHNTIKHFLPLLKYIFSC